MTWPQVSVVIVSRDRPEALSLCLRGLSQLDYPSFEVVVVANAGSVSGIGDFADQIKLVGFEDANISAARNLGIAHAAGGIVAFIDDDAVPVPGWLKHLISPMIETDIAACGGFVIGRNGFSFQWKARHILPDGQAVLLDVPGDAPVVPENVVAKTEGTNMAVRRDVLSENPFDEAFAFYMDETDLNMRLANAGFKTAIVPLAQVHHGYAASARRTPQRVPRDLTQIAASVAVFQRKHGTPDPKPERARQRARLLRHMVAGDMMPGDVWRLMRGWDKGWAAGMKRALGQVTAHHFAGTAFKPFASGFSGHTLLTGRFWQRGQRMAQASDRIKAGERVTLFLFALTPKRHRLTFAQPGIWLQRGGQFGASDRDDPVFSVWRGKRRAAHEVARRNNTWEFDQSGE